MVPSCFLLCRNGHTEETPEGSAGGRREGMNGQLYWRIYTATYRQIQWRPAVQHRELSLLLSDDLEGKDGQWDGGDMFTHS